MSLHFHIATSVSTAAAVLQLAAPAATIASAQGFELNRARPPAYEVSTIYDRLTDTTRVSVARKGSARPFGLGSRVWVDVSFTYRGRQVTPPDMVVVTLRTFTPARGGWAFAHPQSLEIRSGETLKLEFAAAKYEKLHVGLFDAGRREVLSFRVPTDQFVALAAEPELDLRAGNARVRLREAGMAMLREVVRRLNPATSEVR